MDKNRRMRIGAKLSTLKRIYRDHDVLIDTTEWIDLMSRPENIELIEMDRGPARLHRIDPNKPVTLDNLQWGELMSARNSKKQPEEASPDMLAFEQRWKIVEPDERRATFRAQDWRQIRLADLKFSK